MESLQDESDADTRLVPVAKNLQSRMSVESAADANLREMSAHSSDLHASESDANKIGDCKFPP